MIFKSPSEIDMLISGKDSGNRNISWWHTDNAGLSWTKGQTLMSSDTMKYGMTTRTRGAHPDGQFVFYEKDPTDPNELYRKMYLWGESGFVTRTNPPDIDGDGDINFEDFEYISRGWFGPCSAPSWCEGGDLNLSGLVDFGDVKLFTQSWLGAP
jgi:hypothetical protein